MKAEGNCEANRSRQEWLAQAGPLSWKRQALLFSSLQRAVGLEFSFGFPELDEKTFFFYNSKSSKLWELVASLR